jgi:mono/diheme cytochrome c family protein
VARIVTVIGTAELKQRAPQQAGRSGSLCEGGDVARSTGQLRSKSWWRQSVVLASLLAMVGCTNSEPPAAELTVLERQGRSLFVDHCALCHGDEARGDGTRQGLTTPAADLTRIAARRGGDFPFGEIALYIDGRFPIDAHRATEMPIWGDVISDEVPDPGVREEVTRGRVSALVSYLRSIQVE